MPVEWSEKCGLVPDRLHGVVSVQIGTLSVRESATRWLAVLPITAATAASAAGGSPPQRMLTAPNVERSEIELSIAGWLQPACVLGLPPTLQLSIWPLQSKLTEQSFPFGSRTNVSAYVYFLPFSANSSISVNVAFSPVSQFPGVPGEGPGLLQSCIVIDVQPIPRGFVSAMIVSSPRALTWTWASAVHVPPPVHSPLDEHVVPLFVPFSQTVVSPLAPARASARELVSGFTARAFAAHSATMATETRWVVIRFMWFLPVFVRRVRESGDRRGRRPRSPTRWYRVTALPRRSSAATTSGPSPRLRAATRPWASTIAETPVAVARTR